MNEDDYDFALSKIMTGPVRQETNSGENSFEDEIFFLIKEIHEKLKDSPAAIFPFIESCTRNATK